MSDAVQQIKDRLNIIDVISPYVELHKAGKNFKGKSPFSAEKTPSFYVSPDRGMYYCFSTSQGGDIFSFIQIMEGVDFKEALKILAEKAGVELVPENPEKRTERERWYSALEAATVFFGEQLEKESEAMEYLKRRGVKPETIAAWRIGYAPGPPKYGWRETKERLEKQKFTTDELLKIGLIKTTEGGKEPFDVFRDRIMFPMAEPSGKIVAFSGRILSKDSDAPKYVNSPETELYKKSELLFGYDKAKNGIRTLGFSLIVEGQFDVVMCHQAGYHNTVAVSGTALTLHHVQLLERLSDKVVLALDADRAGISAMKRAAELMLSRGLDVKVAEMPDGEDPADMIAKGVSEFKKTIGKSVHVIEFLLHVVKKDVKDSRTLRQDVGKEIYPFVLLLPGRVEQYSFAEIIAKEIGTPVDVVWHEIERLRENQRRPQETRVNTPQEVKESSAPYGSLQSHYTFVLAVSEILKDSEKESVQKQLTTLDISVLEEPDQSEFARTVFTLEQQFAKLPKLALEEEILSRLNQLRLGIIRKRLSELRRSLESGDGINEEQTLQKITELQKSLREPGFDTSIFVG